MTGRWVPEGQWNRIHGDGKSSTNGVFHLETMATSNGSFKVKLMSRGSPLSEFDLEYSEEPSFSTIVADLQARI